MALPASVQPVTVTGTFVDPGGAPQRGFVTFTPSVPLADVTDSAVIAPVARRYELSGGSFTAAGLAATDSTALLPENWTYTVTVCVQGAQAYSFSCFIPHTPSPVDISALVPLQQVPQMAEFLLLSGGQLTGPLYASESPVTSAEVATKGYVDAVSASLAAKAPVQEATAAALPANTATALTLTANFTGALTVDGVSVATGDRVLVKDESAAAGNGIYVATSPGSSITPWVLTRSGDMNVAADIPGAYAYVEQGTANAGSGYIVAGTGPYTPGSTAITWTQITGLGEVTAGAGLTATANTISLSSPVSVAHGGTGSTTQNFADLTTNQAIAGTKTFTGEIIVPAPVNATDAATKAYADAIGQGLFVKAAVQEATTTALPAYTATSSTLTASSTGVLTVDDIAVALSDRVLVKNETSGNAPNNGIYTCTTAGALGVAYVLTRSADMDSGPEVPSAFTFVQSGTVNATSGFFCTTTGTVTLGTTPITWTQFSSAGGITAGSGLTLTGSVMALTSPVTVGHGGTGATTAAAALAALSGAAVAGDLGNTSASPQVISTHLSSPLPAAQGGAAAFTPLSFGAAGDGTTNDDTAVHAAFTAAASAKCAVDLTGFTYLTSTPVPLITGTHVRASEQAGGGLVNNTSDLFSITGTVSSFTIESCTLTASAGHVFNCASGSTVAFGKMRAVSISQSSATHSIWNMPSGTYLDMLVGDGSTLVASGSASVVPWLVTGLANANRWRGTRVTFNGASSTVPFFKIECDSVSAWSSDNSFRDITAEQCVAGIISGLTVSFISIENVAGYDVTTYNSSLFSFGAGTGALRSEDITIRNSGRRGGALGAGAFDVQAASGTQAILLEYVGPESGSIASYSTPAAYTTIIAGEGSFGYVQSGMITAAGTGQASVAPSRLVGGSTVPGPPGSGTWNALDIFTDSSGTVWTCTSGGTPGTWAPATQYAGIPMAAASQGYAGWTSDPLGGTLLGAPASSTWTAGVLYARRIDVVPNRTASGFITFQWLNNASMANAFFSLWSVSGTTITLISSTADLSSQTTGWHRLSTGSFTTPASGVLYVSYMNGTSGVAGGPFTERGAWSQAVPTLAAQLPAGNTGQYRWMQGGSGLTAPPSTFSLSGGSIGKLPFWCALD